MSNNLESNRRFSRERSLANVSSLPFLGAEKIEKTYDPIDGTCVLPKDSTVILDGVLGSKIEHVRIGRVQLPEDMKVKLIGIGRNLPPRALGGGAIGTFEYDLAPLVRDTQALYEGLKMLDFPTTKTPHWVFETTGLGIFLSKWKLRGFFKDFDPTQVSSLRFVSQLSRYPVLRPPQSSWVTRFG